MHPQHTHLTPWRVGIVSKTFFNVPLWAGISMGWFAQEGLDVETVLMGNASQVEPLLSGSLQVVLGTPEATLQNAAKGGPLRIVAGNTGKLSHSLITRAPFKTVTSLRGGKLGILNKVEGSFFQLKAMLAHHGLHYPADYEVVEMGGVPPRHKALLEGTIDGGLQSIPWNYVAEEAGMNNLGEITGYVPDWQFVSVNADMSKFRADPSQLEAFIRVLLRATEWLHQHKTEASMVAEKELPTTSEYAQKAWDYYTQTNALTRDLSVNRKGLEVVIQTQIDAGLIAKDAPTSVDFYLAPECIIKARAQSDADAEGNR
ncbi:MAG: ABC transporter substrate-binding protein [Pseudomonadota bacterium]